MWQIDAASGDLASVKTALEEKKKDVNQLFGDSTAICAVCKSDEMEDADKVAMVKYLLSRPGIDLKICNSLGHNPFLICAERNDVAIGKLLLAQDEELLNAGSQNPNTKGMPPVVVAIHNESVQFAVWILTSYAQEIDLVSYKGSFDQGTILHKASEADGANSSSILAAIVATGQFKDVDVEDGSKATPLHTAVRAEKVQNVKILLAAGADKNKKDEHDRTPFDLAKRKEEIEILALFEDKKEEEGEVKK